MPPRPGRDKAVTRHIGAIIRTRRMEKGLSQERLGEALKLTFQQVQKYEKGTNDVAGGRIPAICAILEITPNQLFGWDGTRSEISALAAVDAIVIKMAQRVNRMPPKLRAAVVRLVRDLSGGTEED